MSDTIDFSIEPQYHREYKDRLFIAIFGRNSKQSKKWRLELYNALNNTNYDNPDALEVNTIKKMSVQSSMTCIYQMLLWLKMTQNALNGLRM